LAPKLRRGVGTGPGFGDKQAKKHHYPGNDAAARGHLDWNPHTAQHVLDVALAWSVVNRHFTVADFLLSHRADINTNWSSHESASILHELVFVIEAGGRFVVRLTPPRTGTFIYHTHLHTYQQLSPGLYGALIVTEPGETYDPSPTTCSSLDAATRR
jgi:multicopper oxidase